jgi:hypothetical protein
VDIPDPRDQQIMLDRAHGDPLSAIGERYGLTRQRVHQILLESAEGTEYLNRLETDLLVALKEGRPLRFDKSFRELPGVLHRLVIIRGLDIRVSIKHNGEALTILLDDTSYEQEEE